MKNAKTKTIILVVGRRGSATRSAAPSEPARVESRNALFEARPVDSIPLSQRQGIDDLLRGPLCRRMLRNIEMDDAPAIVTENDANEQNPEGGGRKHEEVDGPQILDMIVEKAPPGLGRWLATATHVLGNRGLGNGDAEERDFRAPANDAF